ncbi:seminal vesicle secretory protein 6-like [Rattus rattus]|uniref:seminal vesicle secretory protein 6-like n=1 Tax=Rattus rattus TaxID=10117 RepID=UPI0013F2F14F|nr:seminal vesicle secretory protein 6-like [Rattus rattus]
MSPTRFFLLTVLLVLVTEAASRRPREKFSQSAEDFSSESSEAKLPKSIIREDVYEEKKFTRDMASSDDGDDKRSLSAGEIERSFTRKKDKPRFAQEMNE